MSFFSVQYILFFLIVFVVYNAVPCRLKEYILLAASIVFYACFDLKYTLVLMAVISISFLVGNRIQGDRQKCRWILFGGIIFLLAILMYFKFWNYFLLATIRLFGMSDLASAGAAAIIAPIGISFFTLEAIGYMVDVYRGTISAEKDFFKYALYVSFFPKVMSGPIERSTNLLKQIHDGVQFNYEKVRHGFLLILWGSFIKLLIANRLAVIVDAAFAGYQDQTGFTLLIAIIIYGIQLYVDFSGYSNMVIGMAAVFGYDLVENFRQPYFSQNIKEFWQRWHISLSSWLRDYVYIPLGGSKKGTLRRYVNLVITFLVSGIWHGTGLHFVVWGLVHGVYQICAVAIGELSRTRIGLMKGEERFSNRFIKSAIIFALVDFAWLFFRADSVGSALEIINKIVLHPEVGRTIYENLIFAGVEIKKGGMLCVELLLLFVVDICHEKQMRVSDWIDKQDKWFRWGIYVSMAICIIIGLIRDYGIDASTFIYANF